MTTDVELVKVAEVASMVAADCESDASAMDGKPFDGPTVAPILGSMLAMISANARAVELLANAILERNPEISS